MSELYENELRFCSFTAAVAATWFQNKGRRREFFFTVFQGFSVQGPRLHLLELVEDAASFALLSCRVAFR